MQSLIYTSVRHCMKNDNQIILDKLYEISDAVEQLDSAVENVSDIVIEKLGSLGYVGDQVLENLAMQIMVLKSVLQEWATRYLE